MSNTSFFAEDLIPPYYAVIFTNVLRGSGHPDYEKTAIRMVELAEQQDGFLGIESTRDEQGHGITVSYWASEEALLAWKMNVEHTAARERGRNDFYQKYQLRVAKVERAYSFDFESSE
mgnify:CR=1 FL=1